MGPDVSQHLHIPHQVVVVRVRNVHDFYLRVHFFFLGGVSFAMHALTWSQSLDQPMMHHRMTTT